MYATSTDKLTSSIFFIGGMINHVTEEKLEVETCPGCFVISDRIFEYGTKEECNELGCNANITILLATYLAAVVLFILFSRLYKKRKLRMRTNL
jgi:hypothetical protein